MLFHKITRDKTSYSEDGNKVRLDLDCDIVVVSDLHLDVKRDRPYYVWEIVQYLDRIIEKMKWLVNPIFISLGDIFDKDLNGNKGLMYYEAILARFKEIYRITEGRCFMVYGNHEDTYLDITPTALIMNPSQHLKDIMEENKGKSSKRNFGTILKTPHEIRLFDTKITLNHFNKHSKDYPNITGDCNFHIGMYHDTYVNHTMRNVVKDSLPINLIWKNSMQGLDLKDIDLAIFGDFHIPIPPFKINNRRNTIVIIPGSFGRNNFKTETHDNVILPIIKIRQGEKPKLLVTDFALVPYTQSYNLSQKMKDISNISNKIRNLVDNMQDFRKREINLKNFSTYVYSTYGEDWGDKVYRFVRNNMEGVVLNGQDNGLKETDIRE